MILVVLIGLAAGRVTRLVVSDAILDRPRKYLTRRAPKSLVKLIHCGWCVSWWTTVAVWALCWIWLSVPAPGLELVAAWGVAQIVLWLTEFLAGEANP